MYVFNAIKVTFNNFYTMHTGRIIKFLTTLLLPVFGHNIFQSKNNLKDFEENVSLGLGALISIMCHKT